MPDEGNYPTRSWNVWNKIKISTSRDFISTLMDFVIFENILIQSEENYFKLTKEEEIFETFFLIAHMRCVTIKKNMRIKNVFRKF